MSRITIEDLPVGDNLTLEEELHMFGAGLRSFRPTLESLEDRHMLDAGFGYGLQLPVLLPADAWADQASQVRLLDSSAPAAAEALSAALPPATTPPAGVDQAFASFAGQDLPQGLPEGLPEGLPRGQQQALSVQADAN